MTTHHDVGIVELIDRTLHKGVILNADLVITVADIPLLAANIKLALAGVETMLKYGIMNDLLESSPLGIPQRKKDALLSSIQNPCSFSEHETRKRT